MARPQFQGAPPFLDIPQSSCFLFDLMKSTVSPPRAQPATIRGSWDRKISVGPPSFSFSSYNPAGTGNDFADFLLGIPSSYTQGGDAEVRPSRILASMYAQDDIRLRTSLTLNLGLRYELSGALTERDGRNAAFRPGSQSTVFPNAPAGIIFNGDSDPLLGGVMGGALFPGNRKNFVPRVGIAWSPGFQNGLAGRLLGGGGKTSIRAGWGIFHILGSANPIFDVQYLPPWAVYIYQDRAALDASGGKLSNPLGEGQDPFAGTLAQREFFPPLQWVPYLDSGLRDPYQYQSTLSIQRQLPKEVVIEIAYLGNRTLHLLRDYQANPALLTADANSTNAESRRTTKGFGSVQGFAGDGTSIYHGLQLSVARRFASRLMFNAHYVWSRTLDNAGGTGVFPLADRAATPWGRANSDRTHNFAGYWVLDLPGPGRIKLLKPILSASYAGLLCQLLLCEFRMPARDNYRDGKHRPRPRKGNFSKLQRQHRPVHFTVPTYFHLLLPVSLAGALAGSSIDEPTEVSGIILPCGAILPVFRRTTAAYPARLVFPGSAAFQSQNEEDLAFDMHWYFPPTLLETLNGLGGNAQNLRHLALRFLQMPSNFCEFTLLHPALIPLYSFSSYHNGVCEVSAWFQVLRFRQWAVHAG